MSEEEQARLTALRKPVFIKQIVANACGTMALLHALLNVTGVCGGSFPDGTFLHRLSDLANEGKTPEELGQFLNADEELDTVHNLFALRGQSNMDSNTRFHFVAYVNLEGTIWELDGRGSAPLLKGSCSDGDFGIKIAQLLQRYTQMDSTTQFSLMALAPNQGD